MNCLQNSQLDNMKKRILLLAVVFTAGIFFTLSHSSYALDASDETIRILERWTSSHWGQDCFVWIVHYPYEIADAWTESESLRSGMSESERERFRRNFISELKLDSSETFLVSVYSFGARPVNLSPVRDNISLLSAAGERIKPTRFDSSLENSSPGIIQGLVFFPKQSNKDYVIALNGMGRNERIFSFSPPELVMPQPKQEKKPEVVVVNIPKREPAPKPKPKPVPPPPPAIPPRPVQPLFQESSNDMAEFVNSVRERTSSDAKVRINPPELKTARQSNIDNAYVSRENVLRKFLLLWSSNNPNEMYDMLSEQSKKIISRENFAKEIAKDSGFRSGLKSDYRIDWVGEERAKVITTRKTLVFRSVVTRTLGVTREGSSWRIVW
ncbi:MAG: hypothetical protein IJG34_08875 [Synergistaceae bacterium]|nr:hypothetical protein [Synergistaceae bacterium]